MNVKPIFVVGMNGSGTTFRVYAIIRHGTATHAHLFDAAGIEGYGEQVLVAYYAPDVVDLIGLTGDDVEAARGSLGKRHAL